MNRPADDQPPAEPGDWSSYREWAAPAAWQPAVRCRWEQRIHPGAGRTTAGRPGPGRTGADGTGAGGHVQPVIPDGSADIIVEMTTGTAMVVGPASGTVRPVLAPGSHYRGLRLRSEALHAVLDVNGASLRDATVPLDALVSPRLARALVDAVTFDEAGGGLGAGIGARAGRDGERNARGDGPPGPAVLSRRLADAVIDPRVRAACQVLWRVPGTPVDEVSRAIGLSGRQLRRLLLAEAGIGPKTLARVGRLHRFLALAEQPDLRRPNPDHADPRRADLRRPRSGHSGTTGDLAGLAVAAGYTDQPHLTREVRRLTGMTPVGLLAERRGTLQ